MRVEYANIGPQGAPPVLFDNATYIISGKNLQYWFRSLVYFHVGWSRKQLITVPAGSVYAERNFYLFYRPTGGTDAQAVSNLAQAVRAAPEVFIGPYKLPPDH